MGWFYVDGGKGMTVNTHTECYEAILRTSAEIRTEELWLDGSQPRGLTEWEEDELLKTGNLSHYEQKPFWPREASDEH